MSANPIAWVNTVGTMDAEDFVEPVPPEKSAVTSSSASLMRELVNPNASPRNVGLTAAPGFAVLVLRDKRATLMANA